MNNNVQILKVLLMLFVLIAFGKVNGQNSIGTPPKPTYCLFGYISDDPGEYSEVLGFLHGIGIKVISNCDEECLYYVQLNEKYKDYSVLFAKIEKRYSGTCYFKSEKDETLLYPKCSEVKQKEMLTKNQN